MKGKTPKTQADSGMGTIKRHLKYQGDWQYTNITLAGRFYPSSETCSNCGEVSAKLKRQRTWQWGNCSSIHKRKLNASFNLRNLLTLPADSGVTLLGGRIASNKAIPKGALHVMTLGRTKLGIS